MNYAPNGNCSEECWTLYATAIHFRNKRMQHILGNNVLSSKEINDIYLEDLKNVVKCCEKSKEKNSNK